MINTAKSLRRVGIALVVLGVTVGTAVIALPDSLLAKPDPQVQVAAYGAGLQPDSPRPAAPSPQAQLDRIEQKIDKLTKLFEDAAADPDAKPPEAKTPETAKPEEGELYFRELSAGDRASVVRRISTDKMPPPKAPALTPEEKQVMLGAFRDGKADPESLGKAAVKCLSCHGPDAAAKKTGGEFVLFERRAPK